MKIARHCGLAASTFLGCGLSPVAPGTVGTLGAVLLYLLFAHAGLATPMVLGSVLLLIFLAGIPLARWCEDELGETDPGSYVLDEVAGYLVAVFLLPVGLTTALGAFLFFRIFDIAKPFPIRRLESIGRGFGVMADDILAGLYANGALRIAHAAIAYGGYTS